MEIKQMKAPMKCDDAIKCIFNLNKLDLQVYNKLKQLGPTRANELTNYLNRERSTVYRSLQKLSQCGICKKKTKTLKQGGYYHVYQCEPVKNIKQEAIRCLEAWYQEVKKTLESLK